MGAEKKLSSKSKNGSTWWYYQLRDNFFDDPNIRRLQRITGDTGVVIFLQMILKSLRSEGYIEREAADLGETFGEELAFDLNRDVEQVEAVLQCAMKLKMLIPDVANTLFYFPCVTDNIKTLTRQGRDNRRKRAEEKAMQQSCGNAQQSCYNNNNNQKQESEKEYSNSNSYILESDDCLFDKSDVERYGETASGSGGEAEAAPGPALSLSEVMELSENGNVGLSEKGAEEYHRISEGSTICPWNGQPSQGHKGLKTMRAWAKRNRAKHPEYFANSGAEAANAKQDPEDKEGKPLPVWDFESSNYCGYSESAYDSMMKIAYDSSDAKFDELKDTGERLARNKGYKCTDERYKELGENYAALNILMKYEKKNPGALSNEEIAAAFDAFDGYENADFENYFRTHRA